MASIKDFRSTSAFDLVRVDASGRTVGGKVYWKLYAIENILRIIINTVLRAQISTSWWPSAVDGTIQKKAKAFRDRYIARPWHSMPGIHDIYYVDLSDLNEIIRANSHLFLPVVPDIDQWIARIEQVRLPRNIVAHMNWPNETDCKRIDVLYSDIRALALHLSGKLTFEIP